MLTSLRVENLALMSATELEFENGFTAVTGETGAGKSVLLGALSLLSGNRGGKTLIKQGAETCLIEAIFHFEDVDPLNDELSKLGLPQCEEGQLILRRVLSRTKPGKIHINGIAATLAQLAAIGLSWIDFHGPGEPQKLFHEHQQLALLDLYAGHGKDLKSYREAYAKLRSLEKEIEQLHREKQLSPEEHAFLEQQLKEILKLNPSEEKINQLEQDYRRLSSSQSFRQICASLDHQFNTTNGICEQLRTAMSESQELVDLDPALTQLHDRVESLLIDASDLAMEWSQVSGEADFSPMEAEKIEENINLWMQIRRRFGGSVEQVLEKQEELESRLSIQGNLDGIIAEKEKAVEAQFSVCTKKAASLRSKRIKAGKQLAQAVEKLLADLGFKKPIFRIVISHTNELSIDGDCRCEMAFAPNTGTAPLPLRKIASSGEMARVMLAIKSILAAVDSTPILVFDEVDANVGGEVATSVAQLLKKLAQNHQIFCITHLPQVAAVAASHYIVEKHQSDEETTVSISSVGENPNDRILEFARMMGDRNSESAQQHATALLKKWS